MPESLRTHLIDRPSNVYEGKPYEFLPSRQSLPPPQSQQQKKPKKAAKQTTQQGKKPETVQVARGALRRKRVLALFRLGYDYAEIGRAVQGHPSSIRLTINEFIGIEEFRNLPPMDELFPEGLPSRGIPQDIHHAAATVATAPKKSRKLFTRKMTSERIAEAVKLREQGLSYAAIGTRLGCTKTPIRAALQRRDEFIKARDMATADAVISTGITTMNNPIPAPEHAPAFRRHDEPIRPPFCLDWARRQENYLFSPAPESCKATKTRKHRATRRTKADATAIYSPASTQGATDPFST